MIERLETVNWQEASPWIALLLSCAIALFVLSTTLVNLALVG